MREPTDVEIDTARASATEACGRGDLTMIEFEQAKMVVVLRGASDEEILAYVDAATDSDRVSDAKVTLALKCIVWPARDTVRNAFERFPLFAAEVCGEIETDAGAGTIGRADLTPKLGEEQLETSGLNPDQARALLAQYPDAGQLRAIAVSLGDATVRLVVKRPSAFAVSRLTSSARAGKGYGQACADAAVECVVWPSDESAVRALFTRWKMLPSVAIAGELIAMGSAGAITRRKKL